jgi:hypothetical protein
MENLPFIEHSSSDLSAWAAAHFGGIALGHVARNRRAVVIAEAFARRPGASIPQLFDTRSDVNAAYTFFEHPDVDPDALQQQHRAAVRRAAGDAGLVLLIEDGTEVSYSHRSRRLDGLGSIGQGRAHQQGFALHTTLAARCPGGKVLDEHGQRQRVHLLGIADQQVIVRPWPPERSKPTHASKARTGERRETEVWERAAERVGPAPPEVRWERIADREADFYENLSQSQRLGHGYTIRAKHNRSLVDAVGGEKLFDRIGSSPSLGEYAVELRARPKQAARTALVSVSTCAVMIRAPQRPGGAPGTRPPIATSVVRVWEATPPGGVEPLEWILLCDGDVGDVAEARERIARYATRWLIEEYHKALKTGLGAEALQFDQGASIIATVAVMSVVALRLVELREQVRRDADAPASASGLSELEIEILRRRLQRDVTTVRDVALAIGRLGGHMNRASDGMPGWITLWRGMHELHLLVEGVRLARLLEQGG